ncbi:MAG: molybdopterin-dependent oxidoreductase [Anaerolineae bacterium]
MTTKLVNISLLALIVLLTVTGLLMLVLSQGAGWLYDIHRIIGLALLLFIPWKIAIAWRSTRRKLRAGVGRAILPISLILAAAALASIALVFVWTLNLTPLWGVFGYPALLLHWYLALGLLPLFAVHIYRHWYRRPTARLFHERRQVLRLGVLGAGALAAWVGLSAIANVRQTADGLRRFTGSREQRSFAGNAMPVTMLLTDHVQTLDPETWRLTLTGLLAAPLVLSLADLAAFPRSTETWTLDCTNGWYSTQEWTGARLGDVLARAGLREGAAVVQIVSVTGHSVTLPLAQAREALLATHIGGEALAAAHGAPVRLAHPNLRGWLWIKWVSEIRVFAAEPVNGI